MLLLLDCCELVDRCGSLWLVLGRRGSLWGRRGSLWDRCGSLWARCGSFHVLITTTLKSKINQLTNRQINKQKTKSDKISSLHGKRSLNRASYKISG